MTLSYDIVQNKNGDLVLFIFRQDGEPHDPAIYYNAHKNLVTLCRSTEQILEILLEEEDAIKAFSDKEEIAIIELDENTPDNALSYKLRIGRS